MSIFKIQVQTSKCEVKPTKQQVVGMNFAWWKLLSQFI